MKILLVQQDMGRRDGEHLLYPIGLSYIATALRGHEVRIFDPNVFDEKSAMRELEAFARDFGPQLLGVSIRNIDTTQRRDPYVQYKSIAPIIDTVRSVAPGVKVMVGGAGFSLMASEIMADNKAIDFGVYLEGEESVKELVDNLANPSNVRGIYYRLPDGTARFTGARPTPEFGELPAPDRGKPLIDINNYMGKAHNVIGVQSKRGCVFKCTYCSYPFLNERKVRVRKPSDVVDEVERLVREYGVAGVTFVDSIFNVPRSHAEQICNEMISRGLKLEWGAWLTPKGVDEELLRLMYKAGCRHIGYSPDATTDQGLEAFCKGYTMADVDASIRVARRVKDMYVGYNFFCAWPGMGLRGFLSTVYYYFKIPLLLPGRGAARLGWIRLEPHTDIFQTAVDEGIISADQNFLVHDERELMRYFYVPASMRIYTALFDLMLFSVESTLKPAVKSVLRAIKRMLGRKPHYDR